MANTSKPLATPLGRFMIVGMWSEGGETPPMEVRTLADWVVRQRLLTIPGVSQVNLAGEQPRELQITFDSYRAAALGVQINDIIATVSRATDSSGGFADVGRRQADIAIGIDVGDVVIRAGNRVPCSADGQQPLIDENRVVRNRDVPSAVRVQ